MTPETNEGSPPPVPKKSAGDLTSDLQLVAQTVESVHADGYREPGDIAADDVGASRLATTLDHKASTHQG